MFPTNKVKSLIIFFVCLFLVSCGGGGGGEGGGVSAALSGSSSGSGSSSSRTTDSACSPEYKDGAWHVQNVIHFNASCQTLMVISTCYAHAMRDAYIVGNG